MYSSYQEYIFQGYISFPNILTVVEQKYRGIPNVAFSSWWISFVFKGYFWLSSLSFFNLILMPWCQLPRSLFFSSSILRSELCNSQVIFFFFKQKVWNLYCVVPILVHHSYELLLLARNLLNWISFLFDFRQCQLPVNYANRFIGLLLLKPLITNRCCFSWLM